MHHNLYILLFREILYNFFFILLLSLVLMYKYSSFWIVMYKVVFEKLASFDKPSTLSFPIIKPVKSITASNKINKQLLDNVIKQQFTTKKKKKKVEIVELCFEMIFTKYCLQLY